MELKVLQWVNEHLHSSDFVNYLFKYITIIGGWIWLMLAIAFLFSSRTRLTGVVLIVGFSASLIISHFVLKSIIQVPRPFENDSSFIHFLSYMQIDPPDSSSFPSVHAATSFCCAIIIAHGFEKRWWPFFAAILISFSRIFLLLHYLSDVLGGAFVGTVVGLFAIYFTNLFIRCVKRDCFKHEKRKY